MSIKMFKKRYDSFFFTKIKEANTIMELEYKWLFNKKNKYW